VELDLPQCFEGKDYKGKCSFTATAADAVSAAAAAAATLVTAATLNYG